MYLSVCNKTGSTISWNLSAGQALTDTAFSTDSDLTALSGCKQGLLSAAWLVWAASGSVTVTRSYTVQLCHPLSRSSELFHLL